MNAKRKRSATSSSGADELTEITDKWLSEADQYDGNRLVRRGRPSSGNPRQLLSLRLQPQIIEKWRASGPGWQTRMVKVLEQSAPKVAATSGRLRR